MSASIQQTNILEAPAANTAPVTFTESTGTQQMQAMKSIVILLSDQMTQMS